MISLFAIIGTLYLVGGAALFLCLRRAPEGWQDDAGFHLVWRNNDPDRADVACVWSTHEGSLQPA